MTTLSIRFSAQHGEDRVPARVRRIEALGHEDDSFYDLRIIPDEAATIDIAPGNYVVETLWRNGRLTTHRCLVAGDRTELVLTPPMRRREAKPSDRDFSHPSAGGMSWSLRRSSAGYAPHVFSTNTATHTWALLCDRETTERASDVSSEHQPVIRPQDVLVHCVGGAARRWVRYWASDAWAVSSLPAAGSEAEAVTLRSSPEDLPFIAASDPDMGTMTDLLPSGNAEASHRYAAITYNHFSDRDLTDIANKRPLELCAFAYAEIATSSSGDWIDDLIRVADRHALIADIPAILGWRMLMTSSGEDDWRRAGALFEQAVAIGVPFYSLGVKLMAEGLTMVASSFSNHEPSAALLRSAAARIVPTEAFTTVKL